MIRIEVKNKSYTNLYFFLLSSILIKHSTIIQNLMKQFINYLLYCQIMSLQTQEDIHTRANIELSIKLNHNNMNTNLFKNQRLERIKINKGKTTDQSIYQILDLNDENKNKKFDNKSEYDVSTNNHTNCITYAKSTHRDQIIRSVTSSHQTSRNFRKSQKKKLSKTNNSVGKSMNITSLKQEQPQVKNKNNFLQIEKNNNKGPLQIKFMQNWLNDILMQYCYQQQFDTTIKNPALKKYQIDRNSLLSKGINHQKIDRVYRSIFVYSIGFNNLLDELIHSSQSIPIRKTIWKVYAMLLQYCAKGQFQTMVGQIERDKHKKIQMMKIQIQKRQKLIDQSQQLDKQRNEKIYKQIKKLKQQNTNLVNQKAIIQEDFKQLDQAFNEQIALRLKFQHKINQIHGIHRQLGTKHLRLYQDFNAYKIQYTNILEQLKVETSKIEDYIFKIARLTDENKKLEASLNQKQKIIQQYEYKVLYMNKKTIEQQFKEQKQDLKQKNKQRQMNLLKFQMQNAQGIISLKDNALNDQYKQVEVLIQQNITMFKKIEDQKFQIQQFSNMQYKFQLSTLNLKTTIQILQEKYAKKQQQFTKLSQLYQNSTKRGNYLQNQLILSQQKIKILTSDIQNFMNNIQIMRKLKNNLEDDLVSVKQRNQTMIQIISNKEAIQSQLTKKLNQTLSELLKVKTQFADNQSKLKFQQDTFNHQKNILTKKYEKIKIQRDQLIKNDTDIRQLMIVLAAQNEKLKKQDTQIKARWRDEIFQRNNIDLKYKQSLLVMQDQNKYIKQLNISISKQKQQKQTLKRQLNATQFVLQQRTQQYKKQIIMLNQQIQSLKVQLSVKKQWIHPMYYWDIQSNLSRLKYKLIDQQKSKQEVEFENFQNIADFRKKISNIKSDNNDQKRKMISEFNNEKKKMQFQIKRLESNLQENQLDINQLKQNIQKYQNYFKQADNPKQKLLIQTNQQKTRKINQLTQQNQSIQNINNSLKYRLQQLNVQLKNTNTTLKQKQNIIIQKQIDLQNISVLKQQNNKLLEKIKQINQKIKKPHQSILKNQKNQQNQKNQKNEKYQKKSSSNNKKAHLVQKEKNNEDKYSTFREHNSIQMRIQNKLQENLGEEGRQKIISNEQMNRIDKSERTQKTQRTQKNEKSQKIIKQDSKRKGIVRKITGAFNYYNKVNK